MATVPEALPVVAERWDLPDVLLVPMDSLDAYFARVYQIPLLTREEEAELGTAVRAGNRDAALRLAVHNLRYAAYLARKWEGRSQGEPVWSLGDAVQAANIGLWTAVQRYDPSLARFTTYAHWWIRQSWDRARNTFLWQVRLPAHAVREWHAYQQAVEAWTQSRHRKPKPEELAELLGWPLHRVGFWQQWAETTQRPASLDALVLDEDTPLGDLVAGSADDAVWSRLQHRAQQEAV
ncbi:sigma-70 family RNA polymerase sigma factor, partial [Sulfobacillus harzensis]